MLSQHSALGNLRKSLLKKGKTSGQIDVAVNNFVDKRYALYDERESFVDSETSITATLVARLLHNKGMASQADFVPKF